MRFSDFAAKVVALAALAFAAWIVVAGMTTPPAPAALKVSTAAPAQAPPVSKAP
jgi:hypothetical protein